MNVVVVVLCQCHSSGGVTMTSPGRIRIKRPAGRLHVALALDDAERLALRVAVPRGARGRREVDRAQGDRLGPLGRGQAVDEDVAGEPLGRPLEGGLPRLGRPRRQFPSVGDDVWSGCKVGPSNFHQRGTSRSAAARAWEEVMWATALDVAPLLRP